MSRGRRGSNPLVKLVFQWDSMGSKGWCEAHPLLALGVPLALQLRWEVHWDTFTVRWLSPTKPPIFLPNLKVSLCVAVGKSLNPLAKQGSPSFWGGAAPRCAPGGCSAALLQRSFI